MEERTEERIAKWISGDITMSRDPGEAIKHWRERFGINQTSLAHALGVSPSVISDYESGRRKSPGASSIKKIVEAFIKFDKEHGGQVSLTFARMFGTQLPPDVVLDLCEFGEPVSGEKICRAVEGKTFANEKLLNQNIFGYTVVDSHKAILSLSSEGFRRLYGLTTERALVFTEVATGRSPMVAVKVMGITPGMVILHGEIKDVDPLAVKIAEVLRIPLVVSRLPSREALLEGLWKCKLGGP